MIYYSKLKNLNERDLNKIKDLTKDHPQWMYTLFDGWLDPIRSGEVNVTYSRIDEEINGVCTFHKTIISTKGNEKEVYEFNILVNSKIRSNGVGSKLITLAKEIVNGPTICFPWNGIGEKFYKKHGITIYDENIHKQINPFSYTV